MKIHLGETFSLSTHKEGSKFIAIFAVSTLILFWINTALGLFGLFLTGFCISFFRDPERIIPEDKGVVVSSGDGRVVAVEEVNPNDELSSELGNNKLLKITVFLSVFNVHVNRIPVAGKILKVMYRSGKFFNAALEKASTDNERNTIIIETSDNEKVACVQIAGLVAKRIVCDAKEGDDFALGDRYGIIRFGSRMDVYLPLSYKSMVKVGHTVIGGETVIAKKA